MPIKQKHREPSAPQVVQGRPFRDFLISFAAGALVAAGTMAIERQMSASASSCSELATQAAQR